jgi:hypothetical protein
MIYNVVATTVSNNLVMNLEDDLHASDQDNVACMEKRGAYIAMRSGRTRWFDLQVHRKLIVPLALCSKKNRIS